VGLINVPVWECEGCRHFYYTLKEYEECVKKHKVEEEISQIGNTVTIGIPQYSPQSMGSEATFDNYSWTTGRVLEVEKKMGSEKVLVEVGKERKWYELYLLLEYKYTKEKEDELSRQLREGGQSHKVSTSCASISPFIREKKE
jgi:hypothetical protein